MALQIKHITILIFQTTKYLLHCLGKMIVVQKSRFQVTKTLKMNIMKQSTHKYRTHYSLKNLNWARMFDYTFVQISIKNCWLNTMINLKKHRN